MSNRRSVILLQKKFIRFTLARLITTVQFCTRFIIKSNRKRFNLLCLLETVFLQIHVSNRKRKKKNQMELYQQIFSVNFFFLFKNNFFLLFTETVISTTLFHFGLVWFGFSLTSYQLLKGYSRPDKGFES